MTIEATQTGADFDLASAFEQLDGDVSGEADAAGQPVEQLATQFEEGNEDAESQEVAEGEPELELEGEESEGEEDPADAAPTEIPDDHKVLLKVDGKDVEFTFGDLKAKVQKAEAADKRFAEAAQIRKDAEAKLAILPEREKQLGQVLEYYIQQAGQYLEKEPNWAELLEKDPHEYLKQKDMWEKRTKEAIQAKQIKEELDRRNAEAAQASAHQRAIEEQNKLLEALPEWKDPVKAAEGAKAVDEYLANAGLPPEMRSQVDTATVFLIARKAMLYDQAIARQQEQRKGKVTASVQQQRTIPGQQRPAVAPVARPAATRVVMPQADRQSAAQKANTTKAFKANPSVDTLAGFFE